MKEYFYIDSNNQQRGPISPTLFHQYGIGPMTMVWCEGMVNWTPAGEIPELAPYIYERAQDPPSRPGYNQYPNTPNYGENPQYGNGGWQQPAPSYGPNVYQNTGGLPPNSNMVWAVLVTFLCCLPAGIVAIVYASKVDSLWTMGRYEEARKSARNAGLWAMWGAIASVFVWILYLIFMVWIGIGLDLATYY